MNDFKGRHFSGEIVLCAGHWYCRYALSYRDLEAMMTERSVRGRPFHDISRGATVRPGSGEATAVAVAPTAVAVLAHRRDLRQGRWQVKYLNLVTSMQACRTVLGIASKSGGSIDSMSGNASMTNRSWS